jgi:signal transduction histidine kinase
VNPTSVLIVSDDTEFARTIAARWQSERYVPEITLLTSDVWNSSSAIGHHLVIIGPLRPAKHSSIFSQATASPDTAAIFIADDQKSFASFESQYPQLHILQKRDGWVEALIAIAVEALRRVEALDRAQRAERLALASQRDATLGRYMLEMRPSLNNTLTSVLGNADLLLLEPGRISPESREQIQTIHTMALRLNEIMQRFSSLASEMRAGETESQLETEFSSNPAGTR